MFVCAVASAPAEHDDMHAEVVRSDMVVNPDSFQYSYETSNGISAKSSGELRKIGDESGIVSQGDYSYSIDGVKYSTSYVADENGTEIIHMKC